MSDGTNFRGTETWRRMRERITRHSTPTYDSYPDHVPPPKAVLLWRLGDDEEPVDLDGYEPEDIAWQRGWRQRWLADRVLKAYLALRARGSSSTPSSSP